MSHRIKLVRLSVLSAAIALPSVADAQAMTSPAPVLQVGREVVKPGKIAAHTKLETAWSRGLEAAKYPTTFVALTSMSGPHEVWFVSPWASLAAMQKANDEFDANAVLSAVDDKYAPAEIDFLQDWRSMTLMLREDLSYQTARPITDMRFLSVTRVLVRAGHTAEFVEARAAIKAAHEKAKLPDGYAVYQANLGMPAGTFYVLAIRKSLTELDDNAKTHADPAYMAALGPDWTKKNAALVQAYEASSDVNLFAVSAAMSVVPKEWSAADPFWKPKALPKQAP
jgi:hypothetical protein